jgi:hypothetical protein
MEVSVRRKVAQTDNLLRLVHAMDMCKCEYIIKTPSTFLMFVPNWYHPKTNLVGLRAAGVSLQIRIISLYI